MPRVFVFGTLKRGFPLHERGLSRAPFLGAYKTRERYPMLIAGPWFAPMMFNEPGVGFPVAGELYDVEEPAMAALDALESVGKPGNFRVLIEVEPVEGGTQRSAYVYMKARELAEPRHTGYLEVYDDRRYVPPERRP